MRIHKSKIVNIAYWVAAIALSASGAWYVINREMDLVIWIGLILSLCAIIIGIVVDPQRIRKSLVGRQAKYGSNALIYSLAFIGVISIINYLIFVNPIQWDLTEDRLYSLSPETLKVLRELQSDVTIRGFYTPRSSSSRENIRPILDQYKIKSNNKLNYEFIDPEEYPVVAQQYNVILDASLVLTSGENSEVVEYASEQKITEALVRVLNPQPRKVYFLIGHGERDIESVDDDGYNQANRSLVSKNYEVETLNLLSLTSVPEDASVLLIVDPKATFLETEINQLIEYAGRGGALVVLLEPVIQTPEEYEADPLITYLKNQRGIEAMLNFVVDTSTEMPFYGISKQYASHAITEGLGNLVTFFPTSRSLKSIELPESTIERVNLVLTGENSWGETDFIAIESQSTLEFNEGQEELGPLTLVMAVEDTGNGARIVVFGDSDFASNAFFFDLGNGDLLLNSIDWATGEEQLISLTPKTTTSRYVLPPTVQVTGFIFLITILLIPGSVIFLGVSTWWRRRKQA